MEVPKAQGAGRSGPRRRTGCLTCRARKVRCDEAKPSCANCDRLRLRCVFKPPIAYRDSLSSSPHRSRNSITGLQGISSQGAPTPALGPASAAAAIAAAANVSQRSPDLNFFNTVLRSDDHHRTVPAMAAPTDTEPYPAHLEGPFDMLGFMGGITSELEQKHLNLTSGLEAFTGSPSQAMTDEFAMNGAGESQFGTEQRSSFSPDGSSPLTDGASIGDVSDAATRRSWSDPGTTSYEDQLLQHFLSIDPPAVIFGPINMEWKYVRPSVLDHSRDFSPLLNAIYCYSDVHKAVTEGKQWRWAPTYFRVASSEIHASLLGDVSEATLLKVFAAVFFLMLSELFSSPDICAAGTSYLHSSYLILQRFSDRTRQWTGLGHLLVSWVSLLDVKSLIAGRDGDLLTEMGNLPEDKPKNKPLEVQSTTEPRIIESPGEHKEEETKDGLFRSPSYLVYQAIVGPAFDFFVQAQQVVRRIICIDLHHRSRGTLSDEFEVLQIAHKVGADLETLWHRRPSVIDVYGQPEALHDTLCAPVALEVCRTFRQYVANFLANFIYLHRVAFAIYPRTDRVNGAVDKIIQLATIESAGSLPGHLPVSFMWPIFIAGLEGSQDQRQWIVQEMQRMAAARENEPATSISRHPSADKILLLLEEMTRRQDVSRSWADSRCVRRELFSNPFVII
ncbi:hypothetical protein N7533_002995 [Penicillium manginii]|uniref:uncharacterized protein n=1 Tax=Penicillium manginii TaxID=203109 RepID=UPI0025475903|nr:uncharacterized protein N7533_002995 [Penicillium manginii]KAJ5764314.1 hypothetical protein N7533_002995 [Penicillium manginii]